MHIAIAGNIGSGKTTLTKMLAAHYGWTPKFESVDFNPYLADFYEDMERWSFNLQIYFLNKRFQDVVPAGPADLPPQLHPEPHRPDPEARPRVRAVHPHRLHHRPEPALRGLDQGLQGPPAGGRRGQGQVREQARGLPVHHGQDRRRALRPFPCRMTAGFFQT